MSLSLIIGASLFASWQSIQVDQSLDQLAHTFRFESPIDSKDLKGLKVNQPCEVWLGERICLSGYTEGQTLQAGASGLRLQIKGRSKTADLVDCSATLNLNQPSTLEQIAQSLCELYGIAVIVQTPTNPPFEKFRLRAENIFAGLSKLAKQRNCLLLTDERGNLILTRAGHQRSSVILTAENIESLRYTQDYSGRFSHYQVQGQSMIGKEYKGEAKDPQVERPRHKMESLNAHNQADCQDKADWLKRRLSGQSEILEVTVSGIEAAPGQPWQLNTLLTVHLPEIHLKSEFLIVSIQLNVGKDGSRTTLKLKKVEAYR